MSLVSQSALQKMFTQWEADLAAERVALKGNSDRAKKISADPNNNFRGSRAGEARKLKTSSDQNGPEWTQTDDPPAVVESHFVVSAEGSSESAGKLWCHVCQGWIRMNKRAMHQKDVFPHGEGAAARTAAAAALAGGGGAQKSQKMTSFFPSKKQT